MSVSLTFKMYRSLALVAWLGAPSKTISSVGVKPLRDRVLVTALATPTGWSGHMCRGSWERGRDVVPQLYYTFSVKPSLLGVSAETGGCLHFKPPINNDKDHCAFYQHFLDLM